LKQKVDDVVDKLERKIEMEISTFVKENVEKTLQLHKAFVLGLREMNYTTEEIYEIATKWRYCGHAIKEKKDDLSWTKSVDYDTWTRFFPTEEVPDFHDKCVCNEILLIRNDWITNAGLIPATEAPTILVIGCQCKNMFISKKGKTCTQCFKAHRNRTALCSDCRPSKKTVHCIRKTSSFHLAF
jgi:hypothetical protein